MSPRLADLPCPLYPSEGSFSGALSASRDFPTKRSCICSGFPLLRAKLGKPKTTSLLTPTAHGSPQDHPSVSSFRTHRIQKSHLTCGYNLLQCSAKGRVRERPGMTSHNQPTATPKGVGWIAITTPSADVTTCSEILPGQEAHPDLTSEFLSGFRHVDLADHTQD